jgi:glycine dehydrogenase subunit 1
MNYVPHTESDVEYMLERVGALSIEELFDDIPREAYLTEPITPPGIDEAALIRRVTRLADMNVRFKADFLGAGCYRHFIPAVVRHLAGRPEFVTAYTPYQPELSQGTLQTIYEYQTAICRLTGMDISNASMYDGATAACEAALLCAGEGDGVIAVSEGLHPHTRQTLRTYLNARGIGMTLIPLADGRTCERTLSENLNIKTRCVIAQSPNFEGVIEDMGALCAMSRARGARFVAVVNPLSLVVLKPPGEYGADIACGDGQPLGIPRGFGGPGFGFFAVKRELMRRVPGRIVGKTEDKNGNDAYTLTLQAREQHIRREKAPSNICTNHSLCAVTASIYLAAMGPKGLEQAALSCMANARVLRDVLSKHKQKLCYPGAPMFNEFVTTGDIDAHELRDALLERGILGGLPLTGAGNRTLWCATEMTAPGELALLDSALAEVTA